MNEFSVRLQLYERLKAAADEDAAMNTDKILKEMKRNGSKNSEEEADVKLNVKTPNMDKEKTTGEHFLIETQRSNLEFLCSEIEELYTGEEHLFSALMAHLYESTNINNLFQFKVKIAFKSALQSKLIFIEWQRRAKSIGEFFD